MKLGSYGRKRRVAALSAIPFGILLVLAGTGAADAKPAPLPGPTNTTPLDQYVQSVGNEKLDKQQKLMEFKSWITQQPGIEESGYIDQINDATNLSTRLLWHGDTPLQDTVIKEAKVRGITATIERRPQSLPEIKKAAEAIWAHEPDFAAMGFKLASVVGVTASSEAIEVRGDRSLEGTAGRSTSDSLQQVKDLASQLAGVSIDVQDGHEVAPAVGRSNDSSPFYAGGYMLGANGTACSTGFSLYWNGFARPTTARHCVATPYKARDNSAVSYGSTAAVSSDGAGRILTSIGAGRMFDGAWNNSAGYSKPVWGFADVSLGDGICTSGGNSGVHCNIYVTAMQEYVNDGYGVTSNIRGEVSGPVGIAAIQGDSGGPVLVPYTNGYVGAAGMIQSVAWPYGYSTGCGPAHDYGEGGANKCSPVVLFTSMRTIASYSGASLVTG